MSLLTGLPYDAHTIFDDEPEDGTPPAPIDVPPPVEAQTVKLRPHQVRCLAGDKKHPGILPSFRNGKRALLCECATGTGKTPIIADLARRADGWGHGVLILSHRKRLIEQIDAALGRVGIYALIEQGENSAYAQFGNISNTVIGSVASLKGERLRQYPPRGSIGLIMSDEAHHATGDGWMGILDHFGALPGQKGARHVGFTATSDRADGKNLGRVFEELAFQYNIREAIRDRVLVPIEAITLKFNPPIDLRNIKVSNGTDFSNSALDEIIQGEVGRIVNALVDQNTLEGHTTIAFAPDIASAEAFALALQDVGITAESISYKSKDPSGILRRFENREFQVLVNAMILTEGVDIPHVVNVLLLRTTKSRSLYSQMVGRCVRLFPGKEKGRVIDLPYLTQMHDLVGITDLYDDTETDDRIIEIAHEISLRKQLQGERIDLDEVMEEAETEFNMSQRVRVVRRPGVAVQTYKFDPVGVMDLLGMPQKQLLSDWNAVNPASDKQKSFLTKMGVQRVDNMGKGEAGKLITKLMGRLQAGKASIKQVNFMVNLGVDPAEARELSRDKAGKLITELKGQK